MHHATQLGYSSILLSETSKNLERSLRLFLPGGVDWEHCKWGPFKEIGLVEARQYLPFCTWLIALSTMSCGSIHAHANDRLSIFMAE